jgi:hypothetical protein
VFWNRAAREARRQKVLEDLIDLTPEERLLRMDRAVADGDVRAEEVDQAIRLVGRLDALRVMTIPGPRGAATATDAANPDQLPEPSELAPIATTRKLSRRARRRAAIAVTPELIEASRRAAVAPMRHSSARDVAVRKATRAIGSPRRRRLRFAAALAAVNPAVSVLPAPVTVPAAASEASDVAFAMAAVADTKQEEQWPNIAWLRP